MSSWNDWDKYINICLELQKYTNFCSSKFLLEEICSFYQFLLEVQLDLKTTTFQMCARLREIALDCGKLRSLCGLVFLNQWQAVKTQEVLVWQISARDGKMRSICQKHIRTSKQPEIYARLKIKVAEQNAPRQQSWWKGVKRIQPWAVAEHISCGRLALLES